MARPFLVGIGRLRLSIGTKNRSHGPVAVAGYAGPGARGWSAGQSPGAPPRLGLAQAASSAGS